MKQCTYPIIPLIDGKPKMDYGFAVGCTNLSDDCPLEIKEKSIVFYGESFKIRGLGERKLWRKFFKVHRQRNGNATILTLEARNFKPIFLPMTEKEYKKKIAIE